MRTDAQLIITACNMMANHMETGNTSLSADDLRAANPSRDTRLFNGAKIQPLDEGQRADVRHLRSIAARAARLSENPATGQIVRVDFSRVQSSPRRREGT